LDKSTVGSGLLSRETAALESNDDKKNYCWLLSDKYIVLCSFSGRFPLAWPF